MSTNCVGRHQKRDRHNEQHGEKQLAAATTALLGVFAFQSPAAAEQKFQKLTGAQIQAKFPGMELTDEAHWGEIFERNGTLTITSMGHKSSGKWRIQRDQLCLETGKEPGGGCYEVWQWLIENNQLCIEFEKEPIPTSYDVWLAGKQVELRREGLLPLQGILEPSSGRN